MPRALSRVTVHRVGERTSSRTIERPDRHRRYCGRDDSMLSGAAMSGRLLTAKEVQERLGISRSAAYALIARLPGRVQIGRSVRVPEAVLDEFIQRGGDGTWASGETILISTSGRKSGSGTRGSTRVVRACSPACSPDKRPPVRGSV